MDKHCVHKTQGRVCAAEIRFDIVDGKIFNVEFVNGCRGNTQGVAMLAEGMDAKEVAHRLKDIDCHGGYSCPKELAAAIESAINDVNE